MANLAWNQSFKMTVASPAIANRIFDTYALALAFANGTTDPGTCLNGLQLSVTSDTDADKNGIYRVASGAGTSSVVLEKVGDSKLSSSYAPATTYVAPAAGDKIETAIGKLAKGVETATASGVTSFGGQTGAITVDTTAEEGASAGATPVKFTIGNDKKLKGEVAVDLSTVAKKADTISSTKTNDGIKAVVSGTVSEPVVNVSVDDADAFRSKLGLTQALRFIGQATVAFGDATFPAVSGHTGNYKVGDVVIGKSGDSNEYVCTADGNPGTWVKLGDESSYVVKGTADTATASAKGIEVGLTGTVDNHGLTVEVESVDTAAAVTSTENKLVSGKGLYNWGEGKADKATTLAGYGITDAKIESGTITLGGNTITPLTTHQDISGKEDSANKITSWGTEGAAATDTAYPSAKLVYSTITDKADKSTVIDDSSESAGVKVTLGGTVGAPTIDVAVTGGSVASGNTSVVTGGTVYTAISSAIEALDVTDNTSNAAAGITVKVDEVNGKVSKPVVAVTGGSVASGNTSVVTGGTVYAVTSDLQTQINNLKGMGRFLSLWDCASGMPADDPTTLPYTYKVGDYYIVGGVKHSDSPDVSSIVIPALTGDTSGNKPAGLYAYAGLAGSGNSYKRFQMRCGSGAVSVFILNTATVEAGTTVYARPDTISASTTVTSIAGDINRRPTPSNQYTGRFSTTAETSEVAVGDFYFCTSVSSSASTWALLSNTQKTISFANIEGEVKDNLKLKAAFEAADTASSTANGLTVQLTGTVENHGISISADSTTTYANKAATAVLVKQDVTALTTAEIDAICVIS